MRFEGVAQLFQNATSLPKLITTAQHHGGVGVLHHVNELLVLEIIELGFACHYLLPVSPYVFPRAAL
ncbi:hypothetical protein HS99_0038585 [Kitasatospora aureofaciens]|uniref:Uncharacterized protein n=1 Tax=Kitasatospora aureofaciens TaxID=1894 RepID=A0A1E7MYY9_KITAU|nr:hypothetical protein B6264_08640 [Kitasatospora aureofaciens]OEV33646.1 hypothetical protein HS99_0038585 [Kitasatospora aureofaciens]QEV00177.1 hypothetical protein CP971_13580 [Streptomyces viridifaciens]GGU83845.1 hypothetical protein GCM10010502_39970 [Kitasatospora aureofaciens]